jgi:Mg2+ and Co2+ transporter CorA
MPKVLNAEMLAKLEKEGKVKHSEKSDPRMINASVQQILDSCNTIIAGFNQYYEYILSNMDESPINAVKNQIGEVGEIQEAALADKTKQILTACDMINSNIKQMVELCNTIVGTITEQQAAVLGNISNQQAAILEKIGGINVAPPTDLTEVKNMLNAIKQSIPQQKLVTQNREWDFDVVRDMENKIVSVKAKQVH